MTPPASSVRRDGPAACTRSGTAAAAGMIVAIVALCMPGMADQPEGPQRPGRAIPLDAAAAESAAQPASPALFHWQVPAALVAACAALGCLRFVSRVQRQPPPPDVFEVLGEAPLGGQHGVRIVRFGPKTLLVGVSSAGCQTLAELNDPQATACVVAACRGQRTMPRRGGGPARSAAAAILAAMLLATPLDAADPTPEPATAAVPNPGAAPLRTGAADSTAAWSDVLGGLLGRRSLDTAVSAALMFGAASLAPAALLMTTCFVRMSVVLSLLRQGLGTQQLPSNQIVTSLALFLSAMVMWPIWTQAWHDGVEPYQDGRINLQTACDRGTLPVRRWMAGQIEQAGNRDTLLLFLAKHPTGPRRAETYDDVPLETLLPAFLVSELEVAFTIGFRLLIPFLVLDVLVAAVVVSSGLVTLPPPLVSLPLKLLVFVMADGWSLVVQSLLDGVRSATS